MYIYFYYLYMHVRAAVWYTGHVESHIIPSLMLPDWLLLTKVMIIKSNKVKIWYQIHKVCPGHRKRKHRIICLIIIIYLSHEINIVLYCAWSNIRGTIQPSTCVLCPFQSETLNINIYLDLRSALMHNSYYFMMCHSLTRCQSQEKNNC